MGDGRWSLPYASQRAPVFADNVVATSHPLAAQAGLEMLRAGGNAVDAAVAAAIALTVLEPVNNGIGSDAFALVWDGGALHGLNASGRAPRAWTPERFAGRDAMPGEGWDAVTVPGAVSGWRALSDRFGALPFEALFEPAIGCARRGHLVPVKIAELWALQLRRLAKVPGFAEAFVPAPQPGSRHRVAGQAETLEAIARTGGDAFYTGELAEKLVAHSRAHGGALELEDLASHRPEWVTPLSMDYRDVALHELPPNGQGIAALIALGILRHLEVSSHEPDSPDALHLQIEAMKLAWAETERHVGDPDHMTVSTAALLDDAHLARCAARIDPQRAAYPESSLPSSPGTVYLCAADAAGRMVSYIQSNFRGFGSGIVVPGTGIALQNRALGFHLEAGHPNQVGGGKRPFHTIIPGFVTRAGEPLLCFGLMGGHLQAQGHVQMVVRRCDFGQNVQAAADAPRWYVQPDMELFLERGFPEATGEALAARGHRVRRVGAEWVFGGAQLIERLPGGGYCAASEPRKDGQAVGF